ncbi:MAG: MFS transporter [Pseudomonadales bacterium]|nr:MFS transporter [Pseudomonadales bacterium]
MVSDAQEQKRLEGNLRRFTLFRLLYTARFYYPIFTILFLDFGLTLEQFAILNIVWAISIVLAEVPSGAMADVVGRKQLLVYAAVLMVIEMALIVFAPIGASNLLFLMFLGNRICSGLSEAAASGADEALAYDSLKALGREDEWAQILERTTFVVSIGFFVTMILGAFAYDPSVVNGALAIFNPDWRLDQELVIRLPVILTLITACCVLVTTLGMHELDDGASDKPARSGSGLGSLLEPFKQIFNAARWTLNHRFVLFVILAALALDSVGRQFAVLASEYYRIIDIPVSWFGFVGAGMSLIGIANAKFSRYLVSSHSPFFNFVVLSSILMLGLIGISFAIPIYGVLFAVGAFAMMGMVQFQASYYINREVGSDIRATVLSFKGLALNLGLGAASLFYTVLVATLRERGAGELQGDALNESVFVESLSAFPLYYVVLFLLLVIAARMTIRQCSVFFQRP